MQVHEVLEDEAQVIAPDTTLQNAAEQLRLKDQGLLAVWDGSRLVGVLTASNIVQACASGLDPIRARVRDVMTQEVLYCYDDQELEEAAELMRNGQVHRLLVLNRSGHPRGIVSLADLAVAADNVQLARRALKGMTIEDEPPPLG